MQNRREQRVLRSAIRLPVGMRDFLPAAAAERRSIAEACVGAFERWGYRRIITPLIEYADVLERGSTSAALRFVEPSTGEIVALRPDLTPQVARLYATRLGDAPGPIRLCYEGTVLRLLPGFGQRELIQAGVELLDAPPGIADAEVIALSAEALFAAGIADLHVDMGHMGFLRRALAGAGDELREGVARKDARKTLRLASSLRDRRRRALVGALPGLYGEPDQVLKTARRLARGDVVLGRALDELAETLAHIVATGTTARLTVDLGELRGFDYYTGVRFAGFTSGYGDALVVGGRYDDLCRRYGTQAGATGFAVDVEAVAGVLEARARKIAREWRGVLVHGPWARASRIAAALRRRGETAACEVGPARSEQELRAYAERWGFARILIVGRSGGTMVSIPGGKRDRLSKRQIEELERNG